MSDDPIARLLDIMARLRDPAKGCPWDREQSFETIAPYTIEEAYEVADAIERMDWAALRDELGDLLFQVAYHAQMAEEKGFFDFDAVARAIGDKMVRRHPHVFGEARIATAAAQSAAWEEHKELERKGESALDGVARGLPALARAEKLQRRAARIGFDWKELGGVLAKLDEEIGELRSEIDRGGEERALNHELGDVLFTIVNLARHLDIDAEGALRAANERFAERFRTMETLAASEREVLSEVTPESLEVYWQRAKIRS
jgi:MazG family protein